MKRVDSYDPDLMIFKGGGGCMALFGLPFMAAGIGIMCLPLLPELANNKTDAPLWFFFIFGAIFASIGTIFTLGRRGLFLDKRMNIVTTWWGLLIPFKTSTYDLTQFTKMTITKEVRKSKNSSYTVYPVRLVGEESISIGENREYHASRKLAEEIAKFIGISVADSTSGTEMIREAEELDETIREKVQKKGEIKEIPPAPPNMKLQYNIEGNEIHFEIPRIGWHPLFYIPIGFILFFSVIFYFVFFQEILQSDMPLIGKMIVSSFLLIPEIIIFGAMYRFASKTTLVDVSPERLSVTEKWALGSKTQSIPTNELEELQIIANAPANFQKANLQTADMQKVQNIIGVFGGAEILASSDSVVVKFGSSLPAPELQWMFAVIESTVSV